MLLVVTTECVLAASVFSFTAERAVATPTMLQRNRHSTHAMVMATSRHQHREPRFWPVLRSKNLLHHLWVTTTGYLEYHGPTSGFASERMLASTPIAQDACYHGPTSQVGAQRFDCPRLDWQHGFRRSSGNFSSAQTTLLQDHIAVLGSKGQSKT